MVNQSTDSGSSLMITLVLLGRLKFILAIKSQRKVRFTDILSEAEILGGANMDKAKISNQTKLYGPIVSNKFLWKLPSHTFFYNTTAVS
jgi:hypothetical protein